MTALNIRKGVDSTVRWVLIMLMAVLVLNVIWQVFSRYVLQSPSTFTDELARFLMIWVSLLGAAYFSGQNAHIAIRIIPDRLSEAKQKKLQMLVYILTLVFVSVVFIAGCGYQVWLKFTFREVTPALQISMGWVYLVGPVSGLLIAYYTITQMIALWASSK